MTEWHKLHLTHLAFRQANVMRVTSAQRRAVPTKMLWRSKQSLRLIPLNPCTANLRDKHWVFTIRLLATPPTCILGHIEHRRPCLHGAGCYRLVADSHGRSLGQFLIERSTQGYCLWEDGCTATVREAMHGLNLSNRRHVQMRYAGYAPSLTYKLHLVFRLHYTQQTLDTFLHGHRRVHIRQVGLITLTVGHLLFCKQH